MFKHFALVLDTETIGLEKPYVYDMAVLVVWYNGKEYEIISKTSFVIKQIYDNRALFNTAYYADKRPIYTSLLKGKQSTKKHFGHAMQYIKRLIKMYKITRVYAYNAPFDKKAILYTQTFFKSQDVFKGMWWYDIYGIASHFIHNREDYKEFCKANGFVTEKGNLKANVEVTYSFMTDNKDYQEDHIGIKDCEIELSILNRCLLNGYDFKFYRKKFIKA